MRRFQNYENIKATVLQVFLEFQSHSGARSSLPRFHVILPPHRCQSPQSARTARDAASAQSRSQAGPVDEVDCRKRIGIRRADMSAAFRTLSTLADIGASWPKARMGRESADDDRYFPCPGRDRPYPPTEARHVAQHSSSAIALRKNVTASAGTSACFAAAQKPSPFASQALGSGQPDQPLCQ
jgi:hypothetical protein